MNNLRGYYTTKNGTFGHRMKNGKYVIYGIDVKVRGLCRDMATKRFTIKVTFRVGGTTMTVDVGLDSNLIKSLEDKGYIANHRYAQHLRNYIDEQLLFIEPRYIFSQTSWREEAAMFLRNTMKRIQSWINGKKLLAKLSRDD